MLNPAPVFVQVALAVGQSPAPAPVQVLRQTVAPAPGSIHRPSLLPPPSLSQAVPTAAAPGTLLAAQAFKLGVRQTPWAVSHPTDVAVEQSELAEHELLAGIQAA